MKTTLAGWVLVALLLRIATAPATAGKDGAGAPAAGPGQMVPASRPAGAGKGRQLAALEQKLLGAWQGGPCVGDYTFNPDGMFELRHFTPGGNTLTGTWSLRWDALPPTLVVTCKTSDFRKRNPTRPEYEHLGKALEIKLLELDSHTLVLRRPNDKGAELPNHKRETRYERPDEK